jgi:hypothetical protein
MPRSGSTVLTNILDANEDVICPPESSFPAALEWITPEEMSDCKKIGALFVVSCSDGSPLTVAEAADCVTCDKHETLDNLALAIARKMGRAPEKIQSVVWKFTRMVGSWHFAAGIGGRFIILQRNLLNVYESQFRVPFGIKNRAPTRFALFASSYEAAFRSYPSDATFRLDYSEIPQLLPKIERWIGSSGVKRMASTGTLDQTAARNPWHSNIKNPFEDRDSVKIKNLSIWQARSVKITFFVLRCLWPLCITVRWLVDRRQMQAMRLRALEMVFNSSLDLRI